MDMDMLVNTFVNMSANVFLNVSANVFLNVIAAGLIVGVGTALGSAAQVVEAEYWTPFHFRTDVLLRQGFDGDITNNTIVLAIWYAVAIIIASCVLWLRVNGGHAVRKLVRSAKRSPQPLSVTEPEGGRVAPSLAPGSAV